MNPERPAWETRYARKLLGGDIVAILFALMLPQLLSDWASGAQETSQTEALATFAWRATYLFVFALIWLIALNVYDTRSPAVFGSGPEEYKRVSIATVFSFGLLSILVVLTSSELPRRVPYLLTFAFGFMLILLGRWMWRKRLHKQRRRHKNTYRTMVVGEEAHTQQTIRQLRANALAGFNVIGVITSRKASHKAQLGVPVVGKYGELMEAVDRFNVDTLIITSSNALTPKKVRRIGWQLEERGVDLIVASSLTDIAGPRLHVRPVSGLPLIHMESPEFSGWRYFVKQLSDLVGALMLLVLLSPLLAWLAIAVRRDSPGPAIFRQTRLGRDGEAFTMFKFRTMYNGAEADLPSLLDSSEVDKVLFKVKTDPRVTKIGGFMRRHSLDELPQLFNVLRGEMSLVGPRPPLPQEVDQYKRWEHRRLLTRPGMSGLWQVSGRSDLSWKESVRLDLLYVENWSFTGDLLILWRTVRTVFRPSGAY